MPLSLVYILERSSCGESKAQARKEGALRPLRIRLVGDRHLPTIRACAGGGRLLTHFTARGPRAEGHLALGNLSSLGQAGRKLKNFPTKTLTSRRNKKQLRVINPCQHPGPRGQAGGPQEDQVPAPGVRNARGRSLAIWCRASPQTLRGPGRARRRPHPQAGAWGSCHPYTTREQDPGKVVDPEPPPLPSCVLQSGIFLEACLGKFTEGKQITREDGVNNWQPEVFKLRT